MYFRVAKLCCHPCLKRSNAADSSCDDTLGGRICEAGQLLESLNLRIRGHWSRRALSK